MAIVIRFTLAQTSQPLTRRVLVNPVHPPLGLLTFRPAICISGSIPRAFAAAS